LEDQTERGFVVAAEIDGGPPAVAKRGIERAIGVEAGEANVARRAADSYLTSQDDLAVGLLNNRIGNIEEPSVVSNGGAGDAKACV
jgi:hypothetical protein